KLPGVQEVLLHFEVGARLREFEDDRSRPGFALAFGDSRQDVLKTTAAAMTCVRVDVVPEAA
ncbi:MAG TPA: hypothetical protein VMU17_03955, partial [Elusimicrobiota bacterium]|nr:hypothetical protein [Elusimicrobiota bacterium]